MLLALVSDRCVGVKLRCEVLALLTALLHQPDAMPLFTSVSEASTAKADDEAASKRDVVSQSAPSAALEGSGYQTLMRMLLEPLPLMLLAPLQRICRLVRVWEACTSFVAQGRTLLNSKAEKTAQADAICVPVVRALLELVQAIHGLQEAEGDADEKQPPSNERAASTWGLAHSTDEAASRQVTLLASTGIWHGVLAVLSAPVVRVSRSAHLSHCAVECGVEHATLPLCNLLLVVARAMRHMRFARLALRDDAYCSHTENDDLLPMRAVSCHP